MDTRQGRATTLTREALYDLVWSEPMQTIAARFGMSDVALKKRCVRMRIPTPHRGFWAKKAAGRSVRRPALPKLPASVPASALTTVFTGAPKPPPEEVEEATGPAADQARFEELPENRITVPEILTDPHPLVVTAVHLLRKSRTNAQHVLVPSGKKMLALEVSLGTADRAMSIYDALIKALAARGFLVALESVTEEHQQVYRTVATVRDERIPIAVEERIDRTERTPDPKAKYPTVGKQWDHIPTGRLSLYMMLPDVSTRMRSRWTDGSKHLIEMHLNDFVVGLVAASEAIKQYRLEQDARERERQAEQKRREAAEQRHQAEAARVRALGADLKAWRRATIVRDYAVALRRAAEAALLLGDGSDFIWWVEWVEAYAERIDPLLPAPKIPNDPDPYAHYRGTSNQETEMPW